ncbi:MAG: PAS domain S-box protein [Methylovirgula sp.]
MPSKQQLLETTEGALQREVAALRAELQEADDIVRAFRSGTVDAIVVDTPTGKRIYTLKGAEHPYRIMVENMGEGAATVTPAGIILYSNKSFAKMVKVSPRTILGSSLPAMFASADAAKIAAAVRASGPATTRLQATLLASDATPVPVSLAMHAQNEEEISVAIVLSDLTDIIAAQSARDASEKRYRTLVEAINDGLLQVDERLEITFVNSRLAQMLGYDEAELLGRSVTEFIDEATRRRIAAPGEKRGAETADRYELNWRARDGRSIPTHVSVWPIAGKDGRYNGSVSVIADLTETKRLERTRNELARLVEQADDAIIAKDLHGLITFWNKGAEHLYGYTAAEVLGKSLTLIVAPERQHEILELIARAIRGESVGHYETERIIRSGARIWVSLKAAPIRDDAGNITGVSTIARDITALKSVEQGLRGLNAKLDERVAERTAQLVATNRDMESFAYSVSHDLRAPLRAIDGFSLILLEDHADKLDAEGQRVLNVVRDSTVKMGRLIDDILAFSRTGQAEMQAARVNMEALVRELIANTLAPALVGRKVAIDVGRLPEAHGDKAMLQRVWLNLLDNAIKYTAPKPDAHIEVGATAGDGETVYYVRDNGVGFDMQYAGKLFGVFQRLHGSEFPGTGVGLAIIKKIVGRHGGRVWAESKLGEGTTFYFALPTPPSDT